MRVAWLLLPFVVSVLFLIPSAAQQTPPPLTPSPQRDAQSIQSLNSAYQAIGGGQRTGIPDVLLQGTLASPGTPDTAIGSFVAKARGLDFSMETTANGHHTIYRVRNGLGSINIDGRTKGLAPNKTLGLSLDIFPLFTRWTEFTQTGVSVQSVGLTSLDGTSCNLIHVESPDLTNDFSANDHGKVDVCVDAASGLVDSIQYRATQGPYSISKLTIQIRYSDYQQFGGILVPTKITRYIEGKPRIVLRVSQVQFKNGFTDSDFKN
jgi:hypothetical protein